MKVEPQPTEMYMFVYKANQPYKIYINRCRYTCWYNEQKWWGTMYYPVNLHSETNGAASADT